MYKRKPYKRRLTRFSALGLKATALVVGGAATTFVVLAIAKAISFTPDSVRSGNFVGLRHEAGSMPSSANTPLPGSTPSLDQGAEQSSNTVVRNGITVVSPQLRVPIINIDSTGAVHGSEDAASSKSSSTKSSNVRKRTRYAKRSGSHQRTRWKAYGLALR
jgi:hypothetical protein